MAEAALVLAPLEVIESEVQEALNLGGGDAVKALRVTLIANPFLEARIDQLVGEASAGFSRGRVRKAPAKKAS